MATETRDTRFRLSATGDRQVESQFQRVERGLGEISRAAGLAGLALGSGALLAGATRMVQAAAAAEQRARGFGELARSHGVLSAQVISDLDRVAGGTVATAELMEKAGTAMLMGIPAEELSGLMEVARASSRITGQSVTKSFEDIALAVARGSRMILDNLGIIVDVEKANKDYAASLGKTAAQLTDAEKKQAFLNATLTAGREIVQRVGLEGRDTAESMQALAAEVVDLRDAFGGLFIGNALSSGIDTVTEAIGGLNWALRDARDLIDEISPDFQVGPEGSMFLANLLGPAGQMIELLRRYNALREVQSGNGPQRFPIPGTFNPETGQYESREPQSSSPGGPGLDELTEANRKKFAGDIKAGAGITDPWQSQHDERFEVKSRALDAELDLERQAAEEVALLWQDQYGPDFWMLQHEERQEVHSRALDIQVQAEMASLEYIQNARLSAANQGIALLNVFAGKSKAAALAALALQKGLAIGQTFVSGQAAEIRALAELGPVAGPPMAAAIKAWTYTNMGLIAATGIAQAAMSGGGGGSYGGGTPDSPIVTQPTGQTQQPQQSTVIIQVAGDVLDLDQWIETRGAAAIRKAVGRDVNFGLEVRR